MHKPKLYQVVSWSEIIIFAFIAITVVPSKWHYLFGFVAGTVVSTTNALLRDEEDN